MEIGRRPFVPQNVGPSGSKEIVREQGLPKRLASTNIVSDASSLHGLDVNRQMEIYDRQFVASHGLKE